MCCCIVWVQATTVVTKSFKLNKILIWVIYFKPETSEEEILGCVARVDHHFPDQQSNCGFYLNLLKHQNFIIRFEVLLTNFLYTSLQSKQIIFTAPQQCHFYSLKWHCFSVYYHFFITCIPLCCFGEGRNGLCRLIFCPLF